MPSWTARFLAEVVPASEGDLPAAPSTRPCRHTDAAARHAAGEAARGHDPEALQTMDGHVAGERHARRAGGHGGRRRTCRSCSSSSRSRGRWAWTRLAHVVLDEAEDFSLFELAWSASSSASARSCTLAGDEMQQTTLQLRGLARGARGARACRTRPRAGSRCRTVARARSAELARKRAGRARPPRPPPGGPRGRAGGLPPLPGRGAGVSSSSARRCATCWSASRTPRWRSSPAAPRPRAELLPRDRGHALGAARAGAASSPSSRAWTSRTWTTSRGWSSTTSMLPDVTAPRVPAQTTRRAAGCTSR